MGLFCILIIYFEQNIVSFYHCHKVDLRFLLQTFLEHQYHISFKIPISEADTEDDNEEKYFFIILRSSSEATSIGDPSIARVSIINDNGM